MIQIPVSILELAVVNQNSNAKEAIDMYGVILGGWLAFKRILRCNPLNKKGYGFDPVPVGKFKIRR